MTEREIEDMLDAVFRKVFGGEGLMEFFIDL